MKQILSYSIPALIGAFISLGVWWYMDTEQKKLVAQLQDLEATRTDEIRRADLSYTELQNELAIIQNKNIELEGRIAHLNNERNDLSRALKNEKDKVEDIEDRVGDALKTVGVLDKLAKTDSELLQKYSKVYFLNEHYAPPKTLPIPQDYIYNNNDEQYLHHQVLPFFEDMMKDAREDSVDLLVVSAFRSYEEQSSLKNAYTVTYGTGANAFSADQGYSEHQLGTTLDFTSGELVGGTLTGFQNTKAYEWLLKNAHRYGFVLSYPENNSYYIFEPWHWRFVGEDLARDLHKKNLHFYDMDQREIDQYLVSIFD